MRKACLSCALVVTLLSFCGCRPAATAPPTAPALRNVFVLLPKEDGSSSGEMVVSNTAGTQSLTESYSSVQVTRADLAPGPPAKVDPATVQRVFGSTLAALPAGEMRFTLYFDLGGTALTAESASVLPKIAQAYRDLKSTDVSIIGHTDTVKSNMGNYELGLQRAEQVSKEIQKLGIDGNNISIESHGENDLLIQTPSDVPEPRNRRVEVIVR